MIKICHAAVSALVALFSFAEVASASCAAKPTVAAAVKGASVVFVGTVIRVTRAQRAGASLPLPTRGRYDWRKEIGDVDSVTFAVGEAFKGVAGETIEIVTEADGFAGYKFEGGTWLKEGQSYLVYAYRRVPAGAIPDDTPKVLLEAHRAFPKRLAAEINEFNRGLSPFESNVCTRTRPSGGAAEELEQIRRIVRDASRAEQTKSPGRKAGAAPKDSVRRAGNLSRPRRPSAGA